MRFHLTIDTDGAAFADDETGNVDAYSASRELARLLRYTADRIGEGAALDGAETLRDENGNTCGRFELDQSPALADLDLPHLLERLGFDLSYGQPEEVRETVGGYRITRRRYHVQLTRTVAGNVRRTLPIEFTCGPDAEPTAADLVYSIVLDRQYLEEEAGGQVPDGLTLRQAAEMVEAIGRNARELEALLDTDEERDAIGDAAARY